MWSAAKSAWDRVKGWKTVIFHSLYGIPCFLAFVLSQLQVIDLSPLFQAIGLSAQTIALIGVLMALAGVFLRAVTDTPMGHRD